MLFAILVGAISSGVAASFGFVYGAYWENQRFTDPKPRTKAADCQPFSRSAGPTA